MKTVAIIQARMGSTRLPGKVMKDLAGAPMLERVVSRTRRARLLESVLIATSTASADDIIERESQRLGVECFRGSETDVLDRYYRAASSLGTENIARVTSDCPLIDPTIIDMTVAAFHREKPDYASCSLTRTYPRGLDTEVFTFEALQRAWQEAKEPYQRIHVTPYIYQHPALFRLLPVTGERDYSGHRWTVDTPEDLQFVRQIYSRLGPGDGFSWQEVLALLANEPQLCRINQGIAQKALHEG